MNIRDIALTDMRSCGIDTSVFLWETDLIEYVNSAREILGMDLLRKFNGCILNGGYHPKKDKEMEQKTKEPNYSRMVHELIKKKVLHVGFGELTTKLRVKPVKKAGGRLSLYYDVYSAGHRSYTFLNQYFSLDNTASAEQENIKILKEALAQSNLAKENFQKSVQAKELYISKETIIQEIDALVNSLNSYKGNIEDNIAMSAQIAEFEAENNELRSKIADLSNTNCSLSTQIKDLLAENLELKESLRTYKVKYGKL